jgi:hypothetical protein
MWEYAFNILSEYSIIFQAKQENLFNINKLRKMENN